MSDSNYSWADKILHQIALSGRSTPNLFFDLESALHGGKLDNPAQGKHVFIAGLARAGTTLLLNLLHSSDQFASLTYRDMPFVMAPNLWRSLSSRHAKDSAARERAHGDGMMVSADSPEALEEVFWRTFSGAKYLRKSTLVPMTAETETLKAFRTYVALILKRYGKTRYLSKNNNSILRLPSLVRAFPKATILIPFRHPAMQARSLLTQHRRFVETHEADPFSQKYMAWLAHHEFGADHRCFQFTSEAVVGDPSQNGYWIDRWIDAYSYLLNSFDAIAESAKFVCFESVTAEPDRLRKVLGDAMSLSIDDSIEISPPPSVPEFAAPNLNRAVALYDELKSHAANI